MIKINLIKSAVEAAGKGSRAPSGFLANTLAGGAIGAMAGAVTGGRDGRWSGAIGGGLAGIAGGAALGRFARKGAGWSQGMLKRGNDMVTHPRVPDFMTNAFQDGSVRKAIKGFHSAKNRSTVFRSGALLGGGAFGLMFAGNGKSHRRGFNANRGNGFGR